MKLRAYAIACLIYYTTNDTTGFDDLVDIVKDHIKAKS